MRRFALVVLLSGCAAPEEPAEIEGPSHCQIVWSSNTANPDATSNSFDTYIVDMPIEEWTSGTKTFGDQRLGVFYEAMTSIDGEIAWYTRALTTAGGFSVTVASTTTGAAVTFDDAGAHLYFDADGATRGSGGAGSFDGVWSAAQIAPGTGSVAFDYDSIARNVGIYTRWARCYDAANPAFAPESPLQRLERSLVR